MTDFRPDARQLPPHACPRCGEPIARKQRGRPAKWCSQRCRRAAYEERRAAARGVMAIELVQAAPVVRDHDLGECVARVAASPTACRRLLQAMTRRARASDLRGDPKWEGAITALLSLADAILHPERSQSRFWR